MPSWIPTAAIESDALHAFAAGTVVLLDPRDERGGACLAVRVETVSGPALYHLTEVGDLRTGHVTRLGEPVAGFGIRAETPLELDWDLEGETVEPGLTLAGLGCLALGVGGVRLVGASPKAASAHYFDPTDWTQRGFSDRQDAWILTRCWRLVWPLDAQRRIVLFDAAANASEP
jgi:hypothetical protein